MAYYDDPDLAYERHLESRWDPDAMADLALHEATWPNGYGRCPEGSCHLSVFHDGDCEDGMRMDARDLREAFNGRAFQEGHWPSWFRYDGRVFRAESRWVTSSLHGERLGGVVYRAKDFVLEVFNA